MPSQLLGVAALGAEVAVFDGAQLLQFHSAVKHVQQCVKIRLKLDAWLGREEMMLEQLSEILRMLLGCKNVA